MSDTRCPICDRPEATQAEYDALPVKGGVDPPVCYGEWEQDECAAHSVDWRARALAAESECDRLRAFAQDSLSNDGQPVCPDGVCEQVWDAAEKHGLIAAVEVTEPCDPENCPCAEYHGTIDVEGKVVFGDIVTGPDGVKREVAETVQCYRPTALLTGKP